MRAFLRQDNNLVLFFEIFIYFKRFTSFKIERHKYNKNCIYSKKTKGCINSEIEMHNNVALVTFSDKKF